MSRLRLKLLLLERLRPTELQASLLLASVAGVLGALATVAFRACLHGLEYALFGPAEGLVQAAQGLSPLWRVLTPALGGVVAGLVLHWGQRFGSRRGAVDYMEALALGDGKLAGRSSIVRAISSAVSVASGSSIGREGPMVQLAALAAAALGRWRALPRQQLRLLVACGAAAGISTAYNTPLSGALFVAEIMLQSFALETMGPLIVASTVANLISHQFLGFAPLYRMPAFELHWGIDIWPYVILGLGAGGLAPVFLRFLEWAKKPYAWIKGPIYLRLGIGGLLLGAISVWEPGVWGNGYSVVNSILSGDWLAGALLSILVLKVVATGVSTGSGAVGGVFTPTLFVGAALGALFGLFAQAIGVHATPLPAYTAAGMGAFLAACTHAPLMSAVMIFEMTNSPSIIVPLLLVCVLSVAVKRVLMAQSIYAHALQPTASLHPVRVSARDLLRLDPPVVQDQDSPMHIERAFVESRWQHVYVLDDLGRFCGAISLHDFGPFSRGRKNAGELQALIRKDFPHVSAHAGIGEMLEAFSRHPGERLPVLDQGQKLLGFISKTDVLLEMQELVGQ